jgi:hypothetical protein
VHAKALGAVMPGPPPPEARSEWENVIGNQRVDAAYKFRPRTLGDVVAIVRLAEKQGRRVRVVDSGHSVSNWGWKRSPGNAGQRSA